MTNTPSFVCFGEILWDVFPTEQYLGGAPLNVALRLASLCGNDSVSIISALGKDTLGNSALAQIEKTRLETAHIQINNHPTGNVKVTLSEDGNASYQIAHEVAWDYIIEAPAAFDAVRTDSLLVFGSLAARSERSNTTLNRLIEAANFKVFDVNLRTPYYTWEQIFGLLKQSDFVKMNDEELAWICEQLQISEPTLEAQLKALQASIKTTYLCVTLGAEGACLQYDDKCVKVPGVPAKVVDTVGAGDSFLATLLWALFYRQFDVKTSLFYACAMGSLVASRAGANPKIDSETLEGIIKGT
ncbi:MAG: carbohydrate kinase [Gilvibacter sp.]